MTNWITIEDLKNQLVKCLKYDIETNNVSGDFQSNPELQEKLDEHIDQSLAYNDDQYKLIEHYRYWDVKNNIKTLAQIFDSAIEDLIDEVWKEFIK